MSTSLSRLADPTTAGTPGERHRADVSELAGHSRTVLVWTVASRFTGFLRVALLAAPLILPLLTLTVEDPAIRTAQHELGWYLVVSLAPQFPLFGVVSIGIAVQQAHRRFALATAAPGFESLGFGLVLAMSALVFGIGSDLDEVGHAQVLFIGIGATLAVACHAAVQWWGAFRLGVTLRPQGGWLAPELRAVLRMALPSSGNAILVSLGWLAMLVVAGGIPGGAVAFQIAYNLFNLPIALCARPIATAQLPLMASRIAAGSSATALFHGALRLTFFVALPAAFVFLVLADQLALLISVGGMRTEAGLGLVAMAIAGLGLALLGEAVMVVSSSAAYARHDAASPFRAMALQTAILGCGLVPTALLADGPERLGAIGLLFSAATLVGGPYLYRVQLATGWPAFEWSVVRDLGSAIIAVAVAVGIAIVDVRSAPVGIVSAFTSLTVAALLYLAIQWLARSRELALVLQTVRPPELPAARPRAASVAADGQPRHRRGILGSGRPVSPGLAARPRPRRHRPRRRPRRCRHRSRRAEGCRGRHRRADRSRDLRRTACLVLLAGCNYESGERALERGDEARAAEIWEPLARRGDMRAALALACLGTGADATPAELDEAERELGRVLRFGEDWHKGWAQYELARVERQRGRPAEAVAHYEEALERGVEWAAYDPGQLSAEGRGYRRTRHAPCVSPGRPPTKGWRPR